jgi:hypothetical protein
MVGSSGFSKASERKDSTPDETSHILPQWLKESSRQPVQSRQALKSVQLTKRGFGRSKGYAIINVSQFLPKFNHYKFFGKD